MANPAIDHILITVTDPERTRKFYAELLGFEVKTIAESAPGIWGGSFWFKAGAAAVFVIKHEQTEADDFFSEFRVGLDHLAFRASSEEWLEAMAAKLIASGVDTNGVEVFGHTGNKYITFRDPDNIQLEFWLPKPDEV